MTDLTPDPARPRFVILALIRLGGVLIAFLGIVVIARRWVEPAEIVGGAMILVGAIDVMVVPAILARQWRTPRP
ncbi:hypothetical protein [Sphingomonas sp.]|uniref:hypothetical protein n=1 Tax=Sphingomonas sp. TaxID=28214 RepID=UPI0025FEAAFC|nr:hypothetical protein [Sphingomonas sp.]